MNKHRICIEPGCIFKGQPPDGRFHCRYHRWRVAREGDPIDISWFWPHIRMPWMRLGYRRNLGERLTLREQAGRAITPVWFGAWLLVTAALAAWKIIDLVS